MARIVRQHRVVISQTDYFSTVMQAREFEFATCNLKTWRE
jgi:hypothetical protein